LHVTSTDADIAANTGELRRRDGIVSQEREDVSSQVLAAVIIHYRETFLNVDGLTCPRRQLETTSLLQRSSLRHVQVRLSVCLSVLNATTKPIAVCH